MSSPFVAEIRMFGFNFAPRGWAFCDGQLMAISQNTALFSLLGTMYGGNGTSNFGLPNLQGNAAMHQGQGLGLSDRVIGETGGTTTVTLLQSEIPVHTHNVQAAAPTHAGVNLSPAPDQALAKSTNGAVYSSTQANQVMMDPNSLSIVGSSLPHNNMQPYLVVNFCIALQGVFPARN